MVQLVQVIVIRQDIVQFDFYMLCIVVLLLKGAMDVEEVVTVNVVEEGAISLSSQKVCFWHWLVSVMFLLVFMNVL